MIKVEKVEKVESATFSTFRAERWKRWKTGFFHLSGGSDSKRAYALARVIGISLTGDDYLRVKGFHLSDRKDQTALFAYGGAVQPLLVAGGWS